MEANAKWLGEEFVTWSETESEALAAQWAQWAKVAQWMRPSPPCPPSRQATDPQSGCIRPGCVILDGPLGAGKTAWVRGFARGWGCAAEVSSPSFSLVQEYHGGPLPLYHLDFYRLTHEEEVWGLGFEDLLTTGWVLVEWGSRFPGVFPSGAWWWRFATEASSRRIRLDLWEPLEQGNREKPTSSEESKS